MTISGDDPDSKAADRDAGASAVLQRRKGEHLELALGSPGPRGADAGWSDMRLVHEALPELDLDDVDLSVDLLGRRLAMPVIIAGMTGGSVDATGLNRTLARAAQRHGIAMGVGSQRAALVDPGLAETYSIARDSAPDAPLFANVGAAQLIAQRDRGPLTVQECRLAVDMIGADALAVHLNFLEEMVQTEGDRRTRGCADALRTLADALGIPIIAKETGAGMAPGTARRLVELGVAALDVGGTGGTNFATIERLRAERSRDARGVSLGLALEDWGIPTPVAVVGASGAGVPVIATGGVRSGLDAAKAMALGATAVGIGRPLLAAAADGAEAVDAWLEQFAEELRSVMLLTGSRDVQQLRGRPAVVSGLTRRWLADLGLTPGDDGGGG